MKWLNQRLPAYDHISIVSSLRRCLAIVAAVGCAWLANPDTAAGADPFSVVLLPDTQHYTEMSPVNNIYSIQTTWIANHLEAENIEFMIHLGDIVNDRNTYISQWEIADAAHDILDNAQVPYSVLPGNHDIDGSGPPDYLRDTAMYNQYFAPTRFEGRPWYGGHMGATNENNYSLFSAGGMDFMVLSLECLARDATLQWANNVLDAHPDRRVIVATHKYLTTDGDRDTDTVQNDFSGNNADQVFDKLIKNHPNVFMVVCGHAHGEAFHLATNAAGKPVYEILSDYQTLPNGGNGWLRTLRFNPDTNQIAISSYSPYLNQSNLWGEYTLTYDMGGITPPPGPITVAARFDAGATSSTVDGYPGTGGNGWGGAWLHSVSSSSDVVSTIAVRSSNPLKPSEDSGNYVQVVNSHSTNKSYAGFYRDYKMPVGGIDWSKEHTIRFSIRIDEDLTAGAFTTVDDRYHVSNVAGEKNTDTTASWMVTVCGGEGAYAYADDVGEWIFYDGNRDSGSMDVTRTVSSEITVVSGTVYDFTIIVDPESRSYIGTVTDGVHTFTTGTLGWRRSSTEIGDNLMFDTRAGGVTSVDRRTFSLDDVVITQNIPNIPGDTNGDGNVDEDDAATLAANWGIAAGATWAMGDFNNDGRVDAADAAILTANWRPPADEAAGVPEPGIVALLAMGAAATTFLRVRRQAGTRGGKEVSQE